MILFMLITGSILLLKSHINSITHAKSFIDQEIFRFSKNTKFIYNEKGEKLYADFIFGKTFEYVAVLYVGYDIHYGLLENLKNYYLKSGYNVIIICANGFSVSGGNKKVNDSVLSAELLNWLKIIKDTFGKNSKIFLHGFSYTALSALNCANECSVVFADNTHIFPVYNYKNIKIKLLKNKSRAQIPGINVPVFLSSKSTLSKETYKIYELSTSKKAVYIYENFNSDEYTKRINDFITHLKPPEE